MNGKKINNRLRICLQQEIITKSDYDEFFISITEKEINNGILSVNDANERTLCFLREIVDIHDHLSDDKASKYIDITTPTSSTIYKTLLSISEQIYEIYNISMTAYPTVNQLRDQLESNLLSQIPDNQYLLILLDSIDQLHTDAYHCKWLPIQFPSNVNKYNKKKRNFR